MHSVKRVQLPNGLKPVFVLQMLVNNIKIQIDKQHEMLTFVNFK